jgi:DNA-binding NtrC family response regulator
MPTLLVVDDDRLVQRIFRSAFHDQDVALLTASSAEEGLALAEQCRPDVVVLDINLPDLSGLETFRRLHEKDARVPVIFVTADTATDTAIEAMKLGAYDYVLKPLDLAHLRSLVERAFEISRLMQVPAVLLEEPDSDSAHDEPEPGGRLPDALVGRCLAMQEVYKAIGRVARQDVTVLILGESGTGKELVARAIYQHSRRASGPFLAINCAAIPESLLESELFGHEKGAFTGADRTRIGKFEQCFGGTLFLDEVGDMAPMTQTKILRVLQEQQFERVGGNETIKTNIRLIAATNRDLERLVSTGQFRGDLFYRLSVFTIKLPPLRERPEDIPLLVEYFLRRFRRDLGKDVRHVAPEALEALQRYWWPGNLRELQSVLKQSLLQTTGPVLLPDFLPEVLRRPPAGAELAPLPAFPGWDAFIDTRLAAGSEDLYNEALAAMERALLLRVLRHTEGNQAHASRVLGITRKSLRTKIRALGISIDRTIEAGGSEEEAAGAE